MEVGLGYSSGNSQRDPYYSHVRTITTAAGIGPRALDQHCSENCTPYFLDPWADPKSTSALGSIIYTIVDLLFGLLRGSGFLMNSDHPHPGVKHGLQSTDELCAAFSTGLSVQARSARCMLSLLETSRQRSCETSANECAAQKLACKRPAGWEDGVTFPNG